ncbi:hypothetical protein B0H17DRAFT_1208973 [Mycena rosella]|uniref:Uncharacterized protein n=1 Tax=Mycena rosella TaxID=1033263 RepID=A0AAD7GAL7_MYCRO|nr:hypothetical protein B0H17DRAFT_1208973 [Mycena rosella]
MTYPETHPAITKITVKDVLEDVLEEPQTCSEKQWRVAFSLHWACLIFTVALSPVGSPLSHQSSNLSATNAQSNIVPTDITAAAAEKGNVVRMHIAAAAAKVRPSLHLESDARDNVACMHIAAAAAKGNVARTHIAAAAATGDVARTHIAAAAEKGNIMRTHIATAAAKVHPNSHLESDMRDNVARMHMAAGSLRQARLMPCT